MIPDACSPILAKLAGLCTGVGGCSVIRCDRGGLGCRSPTTQVPEYSLAMVDPSLPLPGLSPVEGKEVFARFDGGQLSSDGGVVVLREIERRLTSNTCSRKALTSFFA